MRATKMNSYTEGFVRQNKGPNTQQIDSSLKVVKTDGNTESRVGRKENSWDATDDNTKGCNQEETSAHSGQTQV